MNSLLSEESRGDKQDSVSQRASIDKHLYVNRVSQADLTSHRAREHLSTEPGFHITSMAAIPRYLPVPKTKCTHSYPQFYIYICAKSIDHQSSPQFLSLPLGGSMTLAIKPVHWIYVVLIKNIQTCNVPYRIQRHQSKFSLPRTRFCKCLKLFGKPEAPFRHKKL